MKIFLIILSLLIISQPNHAEEAVATTEESTTEQAPSSEQAEAVRPEPILDFEFNDILKIYFKNNKHKDSEEILWSLIDPEYKNIKNNDFEYQKVKDGKLKEMKDLISKSEDNKLNLNTVIQVGSYDFKKEEFPVKDIIHIATIMRLESSILKNEFYLPSSSLNLDKYELGAASIKILKLDKIKNIKVKKDVAEKITANLDPSRKIYCLMKFDHLKIKREKKKLGKYINYSLKGNIDFSEGKCYYDDNRTQEAFTL